MKKIFLFLNLVLILFLSGCASVPMATKDKDADAKKFIAPAGKAGVYIFRNEQRGAAVKMPVLIDNKFVGDTAAKTFIYKELPEGKYDLLSKGETDSRLRLEAKAGQNYFIWQEMKIGMFSPRTELKFVDEAMGKKAVLECNLIEGY